MKGITGIEGQCVTVLLDGLAVARCPMAMQELLDVTIPLNLPPGPHVIELEYSRPGPHDEEVLFHQLRLVPDRGG